MEKSCEHRQLALVPLGTRTMSQIDQDMFSLWQARLGAYPSMELFLLLHHQCRLSQKWSSAQQSYTEGKQGRALRNNSDGWSRAWVISQEETWLAVWVPFCTGCCGAQEGSGEVREQSC